MDAQKIIDLLARKHTNDLFVTECKMGSSHGGRSQRMDGWAMKKSWTNFLCTGYEVKVARGDWLRDEKYRTYLPFCHAFYFVCPTGLIQLEEVPTDCGLLYVSKTGAKLFTKRRAPHRNIEVDPNIFIYLLMWRTKIKRDYTLERGAEFWRTELERKKENRILGHAVSRKIGTRLTEEVINVRNDNSRLRRENDSLLEIKQICDELDISKSGLWNAKCNVENAVTKYTTNGLLLQVTQVIDVLAKLRDVMDPTETKGERK